MHKWNKFLSTIVLYIFMKPSSIIIMFLLSVFKLLFATVSENFHAYACLTNIRITNCPFMSWVIKVVVMQCYHQKRWYKSFKQTGHTHTFISNQLYQLIDIHNIKCLHFLKYVVIFVADCILCQRTNVLFSKKRET